jgi:hypothetical protein
VKVSCYRSERGRKGKENAVVRGGRMKDGVLL